MSTGVVSPRRLALTIGFMICLNTVRAKIVRSVVSVDDRKLIPLSEAFGFAAGGMLTFSLRAVKIFQPHDTEEPPDLEQLGFFLSIMEADTALEADESDPQAECILRRIPRNSLPKFSDSLIRKVIKGETTEAIFNFSVDDGGLFYFYFANCIPSTPMSFDMYIEMYNVDSKGHRNYLSIGQTELETMYWVTFALFTAIAGVWCWFVWEQRAHAQRIHYMMGVLCLFKALTLMSQALMTNHVARTGHADGWNIVYYIFTFFRGILFFSIVVLIGTGWSYMKPFLGDREKRILMVVIPLQVFANIAIIVMDEESPSVRDWFTWRDVFHLVDIVCCCAILFPIVWSIKHLREASQTDGKAARNLEKLQLFRQFYIIVVVYIYFTRIVVYLLRSTMDYKYEWFSEAADQLATLTFYVWTAVSFRPHAANPYLKLQTTESEIEL